METHMAGSYIVAGASRARHHGTSFNGRSRSSAVATSSRQCRNPDERSVNQRQQSVPLWFELYLLGESDDPVW